MGDVDLVVVSFDDEVAVLYGRCLHRGALMADGFVRGKNLICGVHYWDYRLDSGVSSYNNKEVLKKFKSWINDDAVLVDEDEIAIWAKANPQPFDRASYLGLYADAGHGTDEEPNNALIRQYAKDGLSKVGHHGRVVSMGVPRDQLPTWDDIQLLTAQLFRPPLLDDHAVGTDVVIGPNAQKPLTLKIPLFVKRVFGMVGHSNLGLADAIRRRVAGGDLKYIGVRHEGAAAFAASAYGKLVGRPAALLTIAGPGATNLLTGLWDAKVDRAPVLAMTGQVQTQVFGPGAFQDIDLKSAFHAVSRFSQLVLDGSNHAELMSLACKSAIVQRDVAHLIFPDDVQTTPSDARAGAPQGRLSGTDIVPSAADCVAAIAKLNSAKRPIIVVGHGAYDARDQIIALAEKIGAPVLTTFKAKGLIADNHRNAAGVLGRSGTPIASWFMNEADLIVALGASFSNHKGIAKSKATIQVDFERMQLGKFHPVELPIWADIGAFCAAIAPDIKKNPNAENQISDLADRWRMWRREKQTRLQEQTGKGIHSVAIFQSLSELIPRDAIISVDVGNNTYSFGRYFETKGQRVLMSGYLGSIGFGFPGGMGAWCATQDFAEFAKHKVVSISGDGGFGQYPMDFTTAVKYGMDITHILLNNAQLGKISKEQKAGEWPVWETSLVNPSFAAFARLCGGHGAKVTQASQLDAAISQALAFDGPALVEIVSDPDLI